MTITTAPLPPRPISPFVSPSKSDALAECPHRYWMQQMHPAPDTREQQIGKAVHEFMPLYVKCLVLAGRQQLPEVVDECLKGCGSAAWHADWRTEAEALCRTAARDWQMPYGFKPYGFEFEWALRADGSATSSYTDPLAIAHGKFDAPGIVQPDPKSQSWVWLLDWKTGDWDPEEIAVDRQRIPKARQPRYYLLAASKLWPADNYVWATFHPRLGKQYTATVKRSQIERASEKILAEMQDEYDALRLRLKLDAEGLPRDAWPATPCKWCKTCQFGPEPGVGDDSCPHYNQQQQGVSELRNMLKQGAAAPESISETPSTQTQPPPMSDQQPAAESILETPAAVDAELPATVPVGWELSDDAESPRFKIFIYGDTGTFKTRSILTAFADRKPTTAAPRLAVIDTENGTEHYQREFRFLRKVTTRRENIVDGVLNPPDGVSTVAIDSFTDFCDLVQESWKALYLVRERGAGNKRDYYTLQPRDYSNISEEIRKMIRALIDRADLNVVITAKPKARYAEGEMMQKTGETFDAYKRIPFFMDVFLHLTKDDAGKVWAETERDRTHRFPAGKWEFTPESFAAVVQGKAAPAAAESTPTVTALNGNAPEDAADSEAAQFNLIREAKAAAKVSETDYRAMVARIGNGAASAKQLTYQQRAELIEELDEIASSIPF